MKGSAVKKIFLKEVKEMARDKRVLYSALLGPILLMWVFVGLFGVLQNAVSDTKVQKIHVLKSDRNKLFISSLEKSPVLKILSVDTIAQGEKMVLDGEAKVFLSLDGDISLSGDPKPFTITARFNPEETMAGIPMKVLQEVVSGLNQANTKAVLVNKGVSPDVMESVKIVEKPVKPEKSFGSMMLVSMIPYLVVIWAFYGGFGVVTDMVAGEKEKNTLETLLISPVTRTQIAMGKFLALSLVCFVSSFTSVLAICVIAVSGIPAAKAMFPDGIGISAGAFGTMILVVIPMVAMFSGLLLAISAFSRNTRECQTYLSLASFIVLMPAIFSQFLSFTDFAQSIWVKSIPVLNSAATIREAMNGKYDLAGIGLTIGVSLLLAALAIQLVVKLFNREQVLTRI